MAVDKNSSFRNMPSMLTIATYLLLTLEQCLHKVDGGGLEAGQVGSAVLYQEVMHLFLASEPLREVKNTNLRESLIACHVSA